MQKRNILKITSMLLVVCMLLPLFSGAAQATSATTEELTLDANSVPEFMSYESAVQAGHLFRLTEEETQLNYVIFRNADSSDTIYVFNEDVKYIGSDGITYDKKNDLSRQLNGSYKNSANNVVVTYPAQIASGLQLQSGDLTMQIIPAYANNASVSAVQESTDSAIKQVFYAEAFGRMTLLQYTQTYSGFQEDIILLKRMDLNSFTFTVSTNGTSIQTENGVACVYKNGKKVGTFGEVFAQDAASNSVLCATTVTEITPNQTYQLSISVPSAFLSDESTTFPVMIRPNFSVTCASPAILDTVIYSDSAVSGGSVSALSVGKQENLSGTDGDVYARTLVKFPGIDQIEGLIQKYSNIDRSIESIKYVFQGAAEQTAGITAALMTSDWNEATASGTALWNAASGSTTSVSVAANAKYELDIKSFVDSWKAGAPNYGIMLKAENENGAAISIQARENVISFANSGTAPYIQLTVSAIADDETEGVLSRTIYSMICVGYDMAISYAGNGIDMADSNPTHITQQLRITYIDNGLYQVVPLYNTELCMTGGGATAVEMATNLNLNTRRWYIVPVEGGYRIYNGDGIHVLGYDPVELDDNSINGRLLTQNSLDNSVWELDPLADVAVPLNQQNYDDTCGPASILMVLEYFDCYPSTIDNESLTEAQFEDNMHASGNWISNYTSHLNYYLQQGGSNKAYASSCDGDITETEFRQLLTSELNAGDPVILLLHPNASPDFGYTTSGSSHYVVATGIYQDPSSGLYMVVINDPHYDNVYFEQRTAPLSVIHTCCAFRDHWMITTA